MLNKQEGPYIIYALVDPRDQLVRYIGFTSNLPKRYRLHCSASKGSTFEWIRAIQSDGDEVIVQIVEQLEDYKQAREREIYWTHHYLNAGFPLLNVHIPDLSENSMPPANSLPSDGKHYTYRQAYSRCGKTRCKLCRTGNGHGPYWYAYWSENGRTRSRYIGKHGPILETLDRHQLRQWTA